MIFSGTCVMLWKNEHFEYKFHDFYMSRRSE
nr:MAG TPA: hypothetical protein [Caudoviricetes sp.]